MAKSDPKSQPKQPSSSEENGSDDELVSGSSDSGSEYESDTPPPAVSNKKLPPPSPSLKKVVAPAPASSESESESETESEPEQPHPKPIPSPSPKKKVIAPAPAGSESEYESETESEPEQPPPKPTKPYPKAKSSPEPTQKNPSLRPSPPSMHGKRPVEADVRATKKSKKNKGVDGSGNADVAKSSADVKSPKKASKKAVSDAEDAPEKKPHIQRIWSDEDVVVLLSGMIAFKKKKGTDPTSDPIEFHEFVKGSLKSEFNIGQVMSKVQTLKRKYKMQHLKEENGKRKVPTKPLDREIYQLSKILFDKNGGESAISKKDDKGGANGDVAKVGGTPTLKASKSQKKVKESAVDGAREPTVEKAVNGHVVMRGDNGHVDAKEATEMQMDPGSKAIAASFGGYMLGRLPSGDPILESLNDDGSKYLADELKASYESRWKELKIMEYQCVSKRSRLIADYADSVVEALNSLK